jgi:hypothetical protein
VSTAALSSPIALPLMALPQKALQELTTLADELTENSKIDDPFTN